MCAVTSERMPATRDNDVAWQPRWSCRCQLTVRQLMAVNVGHPTSKPLCTFTAVSYWSPRYQ